MNQPLPPEMEELHAYVDGQLGPEGRRRVEARMEQDPAALWESSRAVLREALAAAGAGARDVAGLGVATQRSTALAMKRPLSPKSPTKVDH